MSARTVYLIIVCGKFSILVEMATTVLIIAALIELAIYGFAKLAFVSDNDPPAELIAKTMRRFIPITLVMVMFFALCYMLVPTTQECAAIIVLPAIVNAMDSRQIPQQLLDLASEWLKAQVTELKKEAIKEK